jgi:hypothetical protein
MISIPITNEMYSRALKISEAQGALKGSIRGGRGNIYGYLGEEIFHKLYPDAKRINGYDHDFELRRFSNLAEPVDVKVDVKTKMTGYVPKPEYEASVTKMPKQQDTHIYYFCRVHKDTRKGWAIGWEYSDCFFKRAYLKEKGDKDPSNGMVCKRTCWNIFHNQLRDPRTILNLMGDTYA